MSTSLDVRRVLALLRRALFFYVFFAVLNLQIVFLLLLIPAVDMDGARAAWANAGAIPTLLTVAALLLERRKPVEPLDPWHKGWLLGFVMFAFWALSYLGIGALVRPERVTRFAFEIDRAIPFHPVWVFLYVCVYPMYLLPFLVESTPAVYRRLAVGYAIVLSISYMVFLTMPVAFDRPDTSITAKQYALWVLGKVHGLDPPWNCFPSTHCAVALMSGLMLYEMHKPLGIWGLATATSIALSTTFTKQHYVIDVVAGCALAAVTYVLLKRLTPQARAADAHAVRPEAQDACRRTEPERPT